MVSLNLFSITSLMYLCSPHRGDTTLGDSGHLNFERWLPPIIILGNPFTAHVLWMGQTTLLVTACLAGGWVALRQGRVFLSGILFALSTFKPQIALLVFLWLVLEKQWRVIALAAAFCLLFSSPAIIILGPINVLREWLIALSRYSLSHYNTLGFIHLFGLQNFLATLGLNVPPMLPFGIAGTIALWWFRTRLTYLDVLPILVGLTLVFGFSHDYDLSALVLLIPAYSRHLNSRHVQALVAATVMLLLFIPQRVFWPSNRPQIALSMGLYDALLVQYRFVLVLILVVWIVVLALRNINRRDFGQIFLTAEGKANPQTHF
jgi:hypothetical protein